MSFENSNARLEKLVGPNQVILGRCKEPLEREFNIRMSRKFNWLKNVLAHRG